MAITLDGSLGITFPDDVVQYSGVETTGGSAALYAARAWGVVDMTAYSQLRTVNVADVTFNATGDVSVTFAQPMATANYVVVANGFSSTYAVVVGLKDYPTVNGFELRVTRLTASATNASTAPYNTELLSFAVFS